MSPPPSACMDWAVEDVDFEVAAAQLDRTWVLPDGTSTDLIGLLAWASVQSKQTVYLATDPDQPAREGWDG